MNIKPWRKDMKRWLELPPLVDGSKLYATSRHHQVQARNVEDGAVLWTADISDQILKAPTLADGETLLVKGQEGDFGSYTALDQQTGKAKWSKNFTPRWKYNDIPAPEGALVLSRDPLAGEDSEAMLQGVSPANGEVLWEVAPRSRSWGIPVRDDQDRLFVELRGRGSEQIMAVDGKTGSVLWTRDGDVWGQPKALDDQSLLLARRDGLSVVDSQSGEVKWDYSQRLTREPLSTPESVVLSSKRPDSVPGTRLTGLDPQTGEVKWSYDAPHVTGVAAGPEGQLLHHAYKLNQQGVPQYYVHALDNETGKGLWSLEVGSDSIRGVGVDQDGRVAVALARGREKELLMVKDGEILWRQPVEGVGVAVVGNGSTTAVMDRQGITVVDSDTGKYRGQVTANAPATNYDGKVSEGRLAMSGVDGELVSLRLDGAQTVLEPTARTPGSFRHYRYDLGENEEGHFYADVVEDGQFVRGEDALLVSKPSGSTEQDDVNSRLVNNERLTAWDHDGDGYLSRSEMNDASLSLWFDRDFDGQVSRGDGVVEMAGEGSRQAVLDLNREKVEIRTSRLR
jgi:outer membrane protein assembly factor BamB